MILGNPKLFALNCFRVQDTDGALLLGASAQVAEVEFGDSSDICPAGVIVHSATVFLSHAEARDSFLRDPCESFCYLQDAMYGDNWRAGVDAQLRARFAVHEIFDVSIGDKGWLLFLEDNSASESRLLYGSRSLGYLGHRIIPKGYVEQVIQQLVEWINSKSEDRPAS